MKEIKCTPAIEPASTPPGRAVDPERRSLFSRSQNSRRPKKRPRGHKNRAIHRNHHQLAYIIKWFHKPQLWRIYRTLKASGLFNEKWYLSEYPDVAATAIDPLLHYIVYGVKEGRNPSAFFETLFYLEEYPDVVKSGINPLYHYAIAGRAEGRWPGRTLKKMYHALDDSPLFDGDWYMSQYPDIAASAADPILHFILHGAAEGRNPSAAFETVFYLEKYADVAETGINPLYHYIIEGQAEGRWPVKSAETLYRTISDSALFDGDWYLSQYPDVAAAALDPVRHYIEFGADEGRNPSDQFETRFYLESYADVGEARINPLYHYIISGVAAGRHKKQFEPQLSKEWIETLRAAPAAASVLKKKPLVSVILPTKDRSRILPNAIESVLGQSYHHWELLIVDDASRDGTAEIIKSGYKDPRIKFLKNEGKGVSHARNHGLRNASGEYIAYLDSDNTWTPQYLELMLFEIERAGSDCVYAALKSLQSPKESDPHNFFYQFNLFDYEKLKLNNFIDLNVFLHRKSLFEELGGFDVALERMVDWDLILRYTRSHPASPAYFIGAEYDAGPAPDRISNRVTGTYANVVRNKHLIAWDSIIETLSARDPELVSVIVSVHGWTEPTEICLTSLFTHPAGEKFEVILVDNGSDLKTAEKLAAWSPAHPSVKLIKTPENFHFALSHNLGFAVSSGSRIVFLNSETEVSPEWLRTLVRPLNHPAILGTQPKLLYPDGSIKSIGIAFSSQHITGYPIYSKKPGNFGPTQKSRKFSALTAACMALRADSFASAQGFDPIYINGQEDIDLCLRIGGGKSVFKYVADAVAVYHGSQNLPIGRTVEENRKIFLDRRRDVIPTEDLSHDEQNHNVIDENISTENPDDSGSRRTARPPKPIGAENREDAPASLYLRNSTIAIKIGCPNPAQKDHWGDYHFATALAAAFLRKGVRARIDFLESWETSAQIDDINLVLRGLSQFTPRQDTINLMWMISHPDKVAPGELEEFDYVFVASSIWADELSKSCSAAIEPLLQCTDACRFHPDAYDPNVSTRALFVANSRKVLRTVVRDAIAQDTQIDIFGEMWEGLAPDSWVKGEKIDNVDLPRYYASAGVVLNDHWDTMRERGFISNRIFDVLACGAPLVSDRVAGLPGELADGCHFFDQEDRLCDVIQTVRKDPEFISAEAVNHSRLVRRKHSFDARADRILQVIERALAESKDFTAPPVQRKAPHESNGIRRLHVGCGPENILENWWNVDIRTFEGIDQIMDVTHPWPWNGLLDYVYGEHFLEHLTVPQAIDFLLNAGNALRVGGKIRLSTPSLEWVLASHFSLEERNPSKQIEQTWEINRAFKGWGHQFLYSKEMIVRLLDSVGFKEINFFDYGISNDSNLAGIEKHGKWSKSNGFPCVWIVEAEKTSHPIAIDANFTADLTSSFQRHVDEGH